MKEPETQVCDSIYEVFEHKAVYSDRREITWIWELLE